MTFTRTYALRVVLLLMIVMVAPLLLDCLMAQPASGPPPGGGPVTGSTPPNCWTPDCIPIDGGLGLLIAAGAALGGRKLYKAIK